MKYQTIVQTIASSRHLATALLLLAIAGPGAATDVTDDACGQLLSPPVAEVAGALAVGTDLQVSVQREAGDGSGETLWVVARDGDGEPVAMTPLPPDTADAKRVEVTLPGALETVESRGLRYTVQVEDLYGEGVGAPFGVLVTLRCAAPESPDVCSYELIENVHVEGGLWTSQALRMALDEVADAGSQDVLADVMHDHPALRGEAMTYAWQQLFLTASPEPGEEACGCTWAVTSSAVSTVPLPPFDEWTGGLQDLGYGHAFFARTLGQSRQITFAEQATSEARLDCWRVVKIEQVVIQVGDRPITIALPVMARCRPPCEGTVRHRFNYRTRLVAKVEREAAGHGGEVPPAVATAVENMLFSVDGLLIHDLPFTVSAQIHSAGMAYQDCLFDPITTSVSQPQPSAAAVALDASIELEVEPGDYAYGRAAARFGLAGQAYAVCAAPREARWDPPIRLEKDILIGNDN